MPFHKLWTVQSSQSKIKYLNFIVEKYHNKVYCGRVIFKLSYNLIYVSSTSFSRFSRQKLAKIKNIYNTEFGGKIQIGHLIVSGSVT